MKGSSARGIRTHTELVLGQVPPAVGLERQDCEGTSFSPPEGGEAGECMPRLRPSLRSPPGIRTLNLLLLREPPLPVGLEGQEFATGYWSMTWGHLSTPLGIEPILWLRGQRAPVTLMRPFLALDHNRLRRLQDHETEVLAHLRRDSNPNLPFSERVRLPLNATSSRLPSVSRWWRVRESNPPIGLMRPKSAPL